tara:strand:+ start:230 stop:436 length:207 start_codon:yes stop_codon:yes gene_type:complete
VAGTQGNTMKNCKVSLSKRSGLLVRDGGLMTISGKDTAQLKMKKDVKFMANAQATKCIPYIKHKKLKT